MTRLKKPPFALALALTVALSCLSFYGCYRLDNKYTRPRPAAKMGVTQVDMGWFAENPLFYLVDQWAFYADKLLTPEEIGDYPPDEYFYIGRYGGFNRGDRQKDPDGAATYRMVVLTDETPRAWALEVPEIFTRWRLWVNGELLQSTYPGDAAIAKQGPVLSFTAAGKIEIVIAVESEGGFYSGVVYPPALGAPDAVERVLFLRLALHGGVCAVSLLIGLLCLLAAAGCRFRRPYGALTLLCLCCCGASAWPFFQALGAGGGWQLWRRACYYGVFVSLLWLQGRVCALPKKWYRPACAVGLLVCIAILLRPLLPLESAAGRLGWSGALAAYKWLAAGWLLAAGAWAARRRVLYSRALLLGGCVFAASLVMGKLLPVHEPVYTGWFAELGGGAAMLLAAGVVWHDMARTYREERELRLEVAVRAEHARLQQDYVRATRESLHESRSRLTLVSHYLDRGELTKLRAYLDRLIAAGGGPSHQYTGNTLVDAVLAVALARAQRDGTAVDIDIGGLPDPLPYADEDLTGLLMNLLDNALEANARLPEGAERWVLLRSEMLENALRFTCVNAAPPPDGESTSKADKRAHGFGLPLLRRVAARYGGEVALDRMEDCCSVSVLLRQGTKTEETP